MEGGGRRHLVVAADNWIPWFSIQGEGGKTAYSGVMWEVKEFEMDIL